MCLCFSQFILVSVFWAYEHALFMCLCVFSSVFVLTCIVAACQMEQRFYPPLIFKFSLLMLATYKRTAR